MDESLYYWKYSLRSAGGLNAQSSRREHEGALIRHPDGGVGCLHPWPELGDLPLDEQLALLQKGEFTPLTEATLTCAQIDSNARRQGRSLFEYEIPESHYTVTNAEDADPEAIAAQGFQLAKLKCSTGLQPIAEQVARFAAAGLRLRLDFNESINFSGFVEFWNSLGDWQSSIEFVEDPIPWSESDWQQLRDLGVPLAADRDGEKRVHQEDILVWKPALGVTQQAMCRYLVTTYMDHAIGQMWAALQASQARRLFGEAQVLSCGLLTHHCFDPDPFFERIETVGPVLQIPEGTGLGFDDLLEEIPWKKLF